jgi:hypothetical protein
MLEGRREPHLVAERVEDVSVFFQPAPERPRM